MSRLATPTLALHLPAADPIAPPQRIAFAGDWHADLSWAVSAVWSAHSRRADVIVHVGDLGNQFPDRYLSGLTAALATAGIPLLFVDGNHDDHPWLDTLPVDDRGLRQITGWIWHLPRGFRWTWGQVDFVALGGAHSVDGSWRRSTGQMWHPQERITEEQARQVIAAGRAHVMVSHDCPAGVDIPGLESYYSPGPEIMRSDEHRRLLRRIVEHVQPKAIWHGHYHVRYRTVAEFAYGPAQITGLDMNGTTMRDNLDVVDLHTLQHLCGRI